MQNTIDRPIWALEGFFCMLPIPTVRRRHLGLAGYIRLPHLHCKNLPLRLFQQLNGSYCIYLLPPDESQWSHKMGYKTERERERSLLLKEFAKSKWYAAALSEQHPQIIKVEGLYDIQVHCYGMKTAIVESALMHERNLLCYPENQGRMAEHP